ncbi:hypothetical protein Tco_1251400 [Tanacetum coccineum]
MNTNCSSASISSTIGSSTIISSIICSSTITIGNGAKGNATGTRGNRNIGITTVNQSKFIRSYNCKGEGHMARQYTGERADSSPDTQALPTTTIFQTNDLDAFDSDCDEAPSASAVLMAKLFAYDSDVLSKVPNYDTCQDNNVTDQSVQRDAVF